MFALSTATRVFLLPGPTDMRKGFDGLRSLAEHTIKHDPLSGHLFVFCNRNCDRVKVLFWDGSGLWVCAKRVEGGRLDWPLQGKPIQEYTLQQLTLLLDGIVLKQAVAKRWHRHSPHKSKNL